MKSKQNDAELIAEAYAEVQEEAIGALAAGVGRAAAMAGKGLAKGAAAVAKSPVTKKVVKGAGKALKKGVETAGGAAIGAVGGAAEGAAKAVSGVAQGAIEGAVGAVSGAVDGATGGLGKAAKGAVGMEDGEHEDDGDKLEAKITKALATGGIDKSDAASIRRMSDSEDAEHEAPVEVDMSQNPDPASLEVSKEVETPCSGDLSEPETPRVNHEDDSEMKMALAELYKIEKYAFGLSLMLKEMPALEGWTAAKITKAADYLGSVFHKLDYDFASGEHATIAPKAEDHEGH